MLLCFDIQVELVIHFPREQILNPNSPSVHLLECTNEMLRGREQTRYVNVCKRVNEVRVLRVEVLVNLLYVLHTSTYTNLSPVT